MGKRRILFVDDDEHYVANLKNQLETQYDVIVAYSSEEFRQKFSPYYYDLIIFDIKLSENYKDEGLKLFEEVKGANPFQPAIILTRYAEREYFSRAIEKGAMLFLDKKEFSPKTVVKLVNSIIEQSKLKRRISFLENRLKSVDTYKIIGNSKAIQKVKELITYAAQDGEISVLVRGESGTGKELVARNIHALGIRAEGPMIAVGVSGLHQESIYSDIFGHEKGSYTGAFNRRKGLLEEAHEGIIFLDEIGDLDLDTQIKLLRVLENKTFMRLGGNKEIRVDVQFVTATNKDLEELVKKGDFREDLYYRLKAFEIFIPPLRERKEDIKELATYFLKNMIKNGRTDTHKISQNVLEILMEYNWPGNVRELKNTIEFAAIKAKFQKSDIIEYYHLPENLLNKKDKKKIKIKDYKYHIAVAELTLLKETMNETGIKNKTKLARILKYNNRVTFSRRIHKIFTQFPELKETYEEIYLMFFGKGEL